MKFYSYGTPELREFNDINSFDNYIEAVNKIVGGLWASPRNKYYSDWFCLGLMLPELCQDAKVVGFEFDIDDEFMLKITPENYIKFLNEEFDLEKFDAIFFTQELIEKIPEFTSYDVESVQVLKFSSIKNPTKVIPDLKWITSQEFREYVCKLFDGVKERVQKELDKKELDQKENI